MSPTVADALRRALKRGLKIGSRPRAASKVGPDRTGRGTCHEGAGRWSRRREAPIRCGFARTYDRTAGATALGTYTRRPTRRSIGVERPRSNRPYVQFGPENWGAVPPKT